MNLETIQEMWSKDSVIDDILIDEASIKIPQLHSKYLTLHSEFTLLLKKAKQELDKARHYKWLYYSGKGPPEMYQDKPFDYKVIKSDVQNWVGVDEDINKIEMKVALYETTLSTLSEILKQVHQMGYHIKSIIDWRRFTNGV